MPRSPPAPVKVGPSGKTPELSTSNLPSFVAEVSGRVEIFETEPDRVHLPVANGEAGIGAMLFHAGSNGRHRGRDCVASSAGTSGGGGGGGATKQIFSTHLPRNHGRGSRGDEVSARIVPCVSIPPRCVPSSGHAFERVAVRAGNAVVVCERSVRRRELAVDEIKKTAVLMEDPPTKS